MAFMAVLTVVVPGTTIWFARDDGMLDQPGGGWMVAAVYLVVFVVNFLDGLMAPFLLFRYTLLEKRVRRLQARINAADISFDEAMAELNETLAHVADMNKQASATVAVSMLILLFLTISSAAIFIWWNAHGSYVVTAVISLFSQVGYAAPTVALATALEELRPAALATNPRRSSGSGGGAVAASNGRWYDPAVVGLKLACCCWMAVYITRLISRVRAGQRKKVCILTPASSPSLTSRSGSLAPT